MWLVVWTTFRCPWWLPSAAPIEVKPIFCKVLEHAEGYTDWPVAASRLQEVGPDGKPKLFRKNGERYEPIPVKFKHLLDIGEN